MREKPILFSGPMVRAILEGRKTQTRRVLNPQPTFDRDGMCWYPRTPKDPSGPGRELHYGSADHFRRGVVTDFCRYGVPGDRLWVRETWALPPSYDPDRHGDLKTRPTIGPLVYGEQYSGPEFLRRDAWNGTRWRPSIHMPQWASRLTLGLVSVRVERLQEIGEEDACAEGVVPLQMDGGSFLPRFEGLWDSLNGDRASWASNPWVWVLGFKRVES